MKRHVKIYMDAFGYGEQDFIPCELCAAKAVDVHHIVNRKSGGNPKGDKDVIDNLMGVCRKCHESFGDVPEFIDMLKNIHLKQMALAGIKI